MITIDDIITQWGEEYTDRGQGTENLHRELYNPLGLEAEQMVTIQTDNTVIEEANYEIVSRFQQFQTGYTPLGSVEFTPRPIPLHHVKWDNQELPHKIERGWTSFLAESKSDPQEWTLVRWMISEYGLKARENWGLNEVWKGLKGTLVADTATPEGEVINGLGKLRKDDITAGGITPFVLGAIPTDNTILEYIENFIRLLPEAERRMGGDICGDETFRENYRRAMRNVHNVNYMQYSDSQMTDVNLYPQFQIKGYSEMAGSGVIFFTPKGNILRGVKKNGADNPITIQGLKREVYWFTDWYEGFGIIHPKRFYTNDQDLP